MRQKWGVWPSHASVTHVWGAVGHRAVANIHLEEWKAALSDVDRALTLEARNADAHVLRAKLYWKLGMLPQGNADMTAAVALAPAHPEVVEFEEARWSIAEKAYQSAASLMLVRACDCMRVAVWLRYGVSGAACVRLNCVTNGPVPSQLRDSAGAILELHRALELAPDDVKYRVLRAAAYRQEVCQPVCPGSSQLVWLTRFGGGVRETLPTHCEISSA